MLVSAISGVIIGLLVLLLLLLFLRERSRRQHEAEDSDKYAGSLRLRLLQAADDLAAERCSGNRLAEASRENYYEKLRLAGKLSDALDDLDDADELIEELEDVAEEALAGWARADSVADRALAVAERTVRGL